jgi:S-(hydroxymethyl)glutathione dehydrogenase/alcohol dehydrogenase
VSYQAQAVVFRSEIGVETISVEAPRRSELTIKLAACGVCHSDLSATNGTLTLPPPLVLGHEGAGIVVAVGEGVADIAIGDHVVTSFVSMCGKCRYCAIGRPTLCDQASKTIATLPDGTVRTHDSNGAPLGVFCGCGVMAELATLHVDNVVKIDASIPLESAALLGCAVTTGVGAVTNTARLVPGTTAVVFGAGGVGLNVIQGCRLAGAAEILAVDTVASKLELALSFGATTVLDASSDDNVVKAIRRLTRGGADYSFECVGNVKLMRQALECCHKGWGVCTIIGVAGAGQEISTRPFQLVTGRVWKGSAFGGARGRTDVPKIVDWYMDGKINIDDLITHVMPLERINEAFDLMHAGTSIRSVVTF